MTSPDGGDFQYVPLDAHVELRQVDAQVHHIGALHLTHVAEVNLNKPVRILQ